MMFIGSEPEEESPVVIGLPMPSDEELARLADAVNDVCFSVEWFANRCIEAFGGK